MQKKVYRGTPRNGRINLKQKILIQKIDKFLFRIKINPIFYPKTKPIKQQVQEQQIKLYESNDFQQKKSKAHQLYK